MLALRPGVRSSVKYSQLQLLLSGSAMSSPGRLASSYRREERGEKTEVQQGQPQAGAERTETQISLTSRQ